MKLMWKIAKPSGRRLIALGLFGLVMVCGVRMNLLADTPPQLPPLTTTTRGDRLPGKFVWADLVTDDVAAASTFYQELFGWSFHNSGNYLIALNAEHPICGMFQRPRPKDESVQPRWFAYMSVSNVQKAERAVNRLGGRVLAAPQKMPKRGEQAIFADPEGAVFGVIRSNSHDPEDFLPDPGDWIWIQLLSRDGLKASEFYRGVGGYDIVTNTESGRLSDYLLSSEGYARAAVRTIPPENEKVQPSWLLFVRVTNLTDAIAKARRLGGGVLLEPNPGLLSGKVAVINDPTGAAVGLLEWSHDQPRNGGGR
jgi:predicted enzyme related to lactoylglutathione lyase